MIKQKPANAPPQMSFFSWPSSLTRRDSAIQLIKYMGSKREIVDFVANTIDSAVGGDPSTILDLMAGTSSVGYALAANHRIISNDIQQYSFALSRCLLDTNTDLPLGETIWELLKPRIDDNKEALQKYLGVHLSQERKLLKSTDFGEEFIQAYDQFASEYPHAGNLQHSPTYNGLCKKFDRLLNERRKDAATFPYCLFTLYFGNAYFGLEQSIEFDSVRYAIDQVLGRDTELRWVAIACLMHAASYCTPGPGHFAQFRALNSATVCEDILRYRNRSPKAYFLQKWEELRGALRKPVSSNLAIGQDYRRALKLHLPETDLVYADPPYSFVHYSRFYHALETLVRYDYPASEHYGRYRSDRHQSPFCVKTKVKKAFQDIILPVAEAKKKLVISYSNTGMITLEDLRKECEIGFGKSHVQLISSDYMHATMGRRGDKHREVKELLIVCGV
jgi:adenine-specific DNA-methyltransferase